MLVEFSSKSQSKVFIGIYILFLGVQVRDFSVVISFFCYPE